MKKLLVCIMLCSFSFFSGIIRPSCLPFPTPPTPVSPASPTSAYKGSPKSPTSSPTAPKPYKVLEKILVAKVAQEKSSWQKKGRNFLLKPCPKNYMVKSY